MKYALLIVFEYGHIYNKLIGAKKDLLMMINLCKSLNINDITVITDIRDLNFADIKLKYTRTPEVSFVCREISQFIENTIRGIEEISYKSVTEIQEILFYISCHGSEINANDKIKQGILLTEGINKRYLISNDLFNLLFGNFLVDSNGNMEIPIWKRMISNNEIITEMDHINYQISNIENINRSTYFANRGIPSSAKMLIIIDSCHSAQLASFLYRYYKGKIVYLTETNMEKYDDLPYCICISACFENEKTTSSSKGSELTLSLHNILSSKCNEKITLGQLNYIFIKEKKHIPVISTTVNDIDRMIPFFSSYIEDKITIINK